MDATQLRAEMAAQRRAQMSALTAGSSPRQATAKLAAARKAFTALGQAYSGAAVDCDGGGFERTLKPTPLTREGCEAAVRKRPRSDVTEREVLTVLAKGRGLGI